MVWLVLLFASNVTPAAQPAGFIGMTSHLAFHARMECSVTQCEHPMVCVVAAKKWGRVFLPWLG